MEAHLRYTQVELECLLWYQMELEGRLQKAIKERRVMELVLSELEEEHEKTISRLELLEHEVVCLSSSILQLHEHHPFGSRHQNPIFNDFKFQLTDRGSQC